MIVIDFAYRRNMNQLAVINARCMRAAVECFDALCIGDGSNQAARNIVCDVIAADRNGGAVNDLAIKKHGHGCCAAADINDGAAELQLIAH